MTAVSSFLNWLATRELIARNPLSGLIPKRNTRAERRSPFSADDIRLIFSQDRFRGSYKHDWQYWLPLLGLFTGARIEELCQIRGKDIVGTADGTFLRIQDREDFSGKTENAERSIPIHQQLINFGFLRLVEQSGAGHLFLLQERDGRRSVEPSKEFGRFKAKLGFGAKHVFHSFRNTFITALAKVNVPDSKIAALAGHAQNNVTFNRYWQADESSLNMAAQQLDYGDSLGAVAPWTTNRP